MTQNKLSRATAARQIAEIVGEFVRRHGHPMPDAEILAFGDNILAGNETTYFTPQSQELSFVAYEPDPHPPALQPIVSFSRDGTGGRFDQELDELIPEELIAAILDPMTMGIQAVIKGLNIWYNGWFGHDLPANVVQSLPRALKRGKSYSWTDTGPKIVVGIPDMHGYIVRVYQPYTHTTTQYGSHEAANINALIALAGTTEVNKQLGNTPFPGCVEHPDLPQTADTAERVAAVLRWWYPQEFSLVAFPDTEYAPLIAGLGEGRTHTFTVNSEMYGRTLIVFMTEPDEDNNLVQVLASAGLPGSWKLVPYASECLTMAIDRYIGRGRYLALFSR